MLSDEELNIKLKKRIKMCYVLRRQGNEIDGWNKNRSIDMVENFMYFGEKDKGIEKRKMKGQSELKNENKRIKGKSKMKWKKRKKRKSEVVRKNVLKLKVVKV